MINKFSCHNFRNIQADELKFKPINILIGPNNSGKSNFIKALTLFSDMLNNSHDGSLKSSFLNMIARNGWGHILNKNVTANTPIKLSWEIDLNGVPVNYKLEFTVGDSIDDCNIVLEELSNAEDIPSYPQQFNYFRCHGEKIGIGKFSTATEKGHKNRRVEFDVDAKETVVEQFRDILFNDKSIYQNDYVRINIAQLLYNLQRYFAGFNVYASAQFDTKKMRKPVDVKSLEDRLKMDASNFVNVFNLYKNNDFRWHDRFEARMRDLIPTLEKVDLSVKWEKLVLNLVYNNDYYDLSDVSEGTLKGLVLNMLTSAQGTLLAIDEPETNLHPAWQKVVGNWIQTSEQVKQCFISTHSPDFLDVFTDGFKAGRVAVFVFGDGTVKSINYENIKDDLGDWELGDLYRTNDPALGGWPW